MDLRQFHLLSVLKVATIVWTWLGLMIAVAVALGWRALAASGNVGRFEALMQDLGFNEFRVAGDAIFRVTGVTLAVAIGGGLVLTCLLAAMFNLVASLVGGVKVGLTTTMDQPDVPRSRAGRTEHQPFRLAVAHGVSDGAGSTDGGSARHSPAPAHPPRARVGTPTSAGTPPVPAASAAVLLTRTDGPGRSTAPPPNHRPPASGVEDH